MVRIVSVITEKGRDYQEWYWLKDKGLKSASKLSKGEILEYLSTHDIPEIIASPWPRRRKEFVSGRTADWRYNGICTSERKMNGLAEPLDAILYQDTYWNGVLFEAEKRGLVKFKPDLITHVMSLRLTRAFKDIRSEFKEKPRYSGLVVCAGV